MIRLLHLGDIHPNNSATFAGKTVLDSATGLNQSLTDLQKSLNFAVAVALAAETRCDVALLTGDIFDSPRPHANEVRVIVDFVLRLAEEMPVVIITGNHDISQNPQDASALECLAGIGNVFLRERPDTQVLELQGERVRICCLPYPTKGRLLTQELAKEASPEAVTAFINDGLAAILRGFRFDIEPDELSVLLAHGSVSNAKVGEQPRSLAHDILIPLQECEQFNYVALGHIHQGQQVAPNAWYSSSLMRQSFGEEHEEKGFNLVSLEPGHPARVAFIHNPHARVYRTLRAVDIDDDLLATPLDPSIVWRFKDQLIAEDYQRLKPILDELQAGTPFFQIDVELVSEDRARDAGMASMLTMEDALARALTGTIDDAELPSVFEKHQQLVQEVAA
ncbi:MAG TPA: exonuclease subunit SbcD [Nitrospiraceae bacterium]|nr:exonuclease subunit SbcD [Nitrospiraceae bacterium]